MTLHAACSAGCAKTLAPRTRWNLLRILRWPTTAGRARFGTAICSNRARRRRGTRDKNSMEIRRDPITQSWVVCGQREQLEGTEGQCPFDPGVVESAKAILTWPAEGVWQGRVIPHPAALYRVENDPGRAAEGIYDKMGPLGAHELVIETREHDKKFTQLSDEEIERVLWVWGLRIADLKKDARFKYVSVFKNQGALAGEEWDHAHSEVTATIFVPRRIKYELVSSHEW